MPCGPLASGLPVDAAAAIGMVFLGIVVLTTVLMTGWSVVMVCRILFPERTLPFDPAARRERASAQGIAHPVRLRDIVEDQRRQQAEPVRPAAASPDAEPAAHPLFDDLWLRRN